VQYSLLDRRAAGQMARLAQDQGFKLICYGGLAGGLLSDNWYGVSEPRVLGSGLIDRARR
ncbi:MAG: hypothetical protein ACRETL_06505, partial [Gammaproteobacteria bacterium]